MIRILGAGLLIVGSTMVGREAVDNLKRRVKELSLLIISLEYMERELQCSLLPLKEILESMSKETGRSTGRFFQYCCLEMERLDGQPFSLCWERAITRTDFCLTTEDKALLSELGGSLGRYDSAHQCEAISQTRMRLSTNLRAAEERYAGLGKVYTALSVTVGCFLVLLLL